jgi:hypothetical protein
MATPRQWLSMVKVASAIIRHRKNNLSPVIQADLAQPDLILPTTKGSTEPSPVSNGWIESLPPPISPHHDQNMLPFGMVRLTSSPISEVRPSLSAWPTPSFPKHRTGPQGSLPQLLFRTCCHNGYRVLVDSSDSALKIENVFESPLAPSERGQTASSFYHDLVDKKPDEIELRANSLTLLRSGEDIYPVGCQERPLCLRKLGIDLETEPE